MPDAIDPAERIERLLDKAEPRLARSFRAAIARLRDRLDLKVVADLLLAGDFEAVLALTQDVSRELGSAVNLEFFTAGQDTARFLRGLDLGTIVFDQINVRAVRALQLNTLRLISEFDDEQRAATRLALLDGIARGVGPAEQARAFRDSVGLTERQQLAVINYRRLLNGTSEEQREALTRQLHDRRLGPRLKPGKRQELKPLTPAQIDRMVERYTARYVQYRANVIARTEALRSVHQGVEEAYEQAIEAGVMSADDLIRAWDSSRDGRVRLTHKALHGQKRRWKETWQTVNGTLRYPGDPEAPAEETIQCRCLLTTRIRLANDNARPGLRKALVCEAA